ncbi:MAG: Tfp pilus assembly protein FimT/FimU [Betaproteobacteria bacterium]
MKFLRQPPVGSRFARRQCVRGFTMVELMVVVSIIAILLAVGMPFLGNFLARNEAVATAGALRSAIDRASYEAGARNRVVRLCASADPAAADPTCATGTVDWARGWFAWVDTDNDGRRDAAEVADADGDGVVEAAEEVLFLQTTLAVTTGSGPTIQSNVATIFFAPPEAAARSSGGNFCISRRPAGSADAGQFPRCVSVTVAGLATVVEGTCSATVTC